MIQHANEILSPTQGKSSLRRRVLHRAAVSLLCWPEGGPSPTDLRPSGKSGALARDGYHGEAVSVSVFLTSCRSGSTETGRVFLKEFIELPSDTADLGV